MPIVFFWVKYYFRFLLLLWCAAEGFNYLLSSYHIGKTISVFFVKCCDNLLIPFFDGSIGSSAGCFGNIYTVFSISAILAIKNIRVIFSEAFWLFI